MKYKAIYALAIVVMALGFLPSRAVLAANTPSLEEFQSALKKTESGILTGVYVNGVLAARVVQQSSASYVSSVAGVLTQFGLASQYGSIGILAHNYLAGGSFSRLTSGTEIVLVYGDGNIKKFTVNTIKKYQALNPNDPYSDFVNLDNPQKTLSSSDVFSETYATSGNLVLQTCISKNGNSSWGRMFVIATPAG